MICHGRGSDDLINKDKCSSTREKIIMDLQLLVPCPKKNDVLEFKICPKRNDVLLNLACVHVHVGMQQSIST
jgi:hypothetical protein